MNELKNDTNLREAVSRREQKLPPLPADLNERLMQRLGEPETAPKAKARSLWFYAAIAAAACIALFVIFHFGKEQAPQEPLVAQTIEQPASTVGEPAEPPVAEPVEVVEEPEPIAAEVQPAQKSAKKQRKVVVKLVELLPTSEAESTNDTDPLVAMAAQVEDIRQRGQRLQQEIDIFMED